MPSASQSARVVTPGAGLRWSSRVRNPTRSRAASSSSVGAPPGGSAPSTRACTSSRVQRGESDVKILVPYSAQPPVAGSARVVASKSTESLPASEMPNAKTSPATASSKIRRARSSPRRWSV